MNKNKNESIYLCRISTGFWIYNTWVENKRKPVHQRMSCCVSIVSFWLHRHMIRFANNTANEWDGKKASKKDKKKRKENTTRTHEYRGRERWRWRRERNITITILIRIKNNNQFIKWCAIYVRDVGARETGAKTTRQNLIRYSFWHHKIHSQRMLYTCERVCAKVFCFYFG